MAALQLSRGSADGVTMGQSTSDLISFFGVSPVALQGGTALATVTQTTIATLTSGFGFGTSAGFNNLFAQVEAIRLALVNYGIVKTS